MTKQMLIVTGPQGAGNHLWSKIFSLHPKVYGWKSLLENYYSIIPDIRTHWDKGFTELILLSSFLEQRKIKYLMFDMCNDFDEKHLVNFKGFAKLDLIKNNKNIIDLTVFCGNRFMWNTLDVIQKQKIDPTAHHHNKIQYTQLEKYLLNYLRL